MRLRLHASRDRQGQPGPASLMLSPGDDGAWCRVDAGAGGDTDRDAAIVLTGMARDQVGGLLDLREGAPIDLYATPAVFEHLTQALPLLPVLQQFCGVQWHLIPVAGEQRTAEFSVERSPSLQFTAITSGQAAPGESIALAVRDERSGARLFVVQGQSLESASFDALLDWMKDADCVVIDRAPPDAGSLWLDRLATMPGPRKLLLHANGSDRALIAACGIECAQQTLEFEL
jgi:pyrroloquinoline quinone biosynthesis protein B